MHVLVCLLALLAANVAAAQTAGTETVGAALLRAYPDHLAAVDGVGADAALRWKDGTTMPVGGDAAQSLATWLAAPAIGDIWRFPYPVGDAGVPPPRDSDPGRARPVALFQKMYGDCAKAEVARHLVDVVWLPTKSGQKLKATRVNGVAARLQAISNALDALPVAFDVVLKPSAGTYACRPIAGTGQPSAHGYGIAIDLATGPADYWRWRPGGANAYRNRIPMQIVQIFEAHGFIWGGKWWHYDTMHFEYRPELLPPTQPAPPPQ